MLGNPVGAVEKHFADPGILSALEAADAAAVDRMPFGVIRMDHAGVVTAYNAYESTASGLSPERVVGRPFFSAVGPCMDNPLVGGRFEAEAELDEIIPYVFSFGVRPATVRLRLLKSGSFHHRYLLVERR